MRRCRCWADYTRRQRSPMADIVVDLACVPRSYLNSAASRLEQYSAAVGVSFAVAVVLAPAILSFYRRRVVRLMDLSEFHAGRQGTANELARVIKPCALHRERSGQRSSIASV
jgi:hypothetical protein